ncbi:MAG: hypothetical protein JO359_14290, partial [Candidatus Eremiobacteraeota bacterium]|nr:hypothetical protein [Candidatus Eremiobacteraeota bacterium]
MIALWFAALLALATPAPAPPLALSVSLSASRVPALAPVTVAVVLVSRERKPTTLEFPTPDLFFVQVRDASGAVVYDSRTGHKPIPIHRSFDVEPGRNKIASFDWNGLDDERRTPAVPGSYVVHVEMPALRATLAADAALTIEAPQTIESVLSAPKPSVV